MKNSIKLILLALFCLANCLDVNAQVLNKKKLSKKQRAFDRQVERTAAPDRYLKKFKKSKELQNRICGCRKNIVKNGNFVQGTNTGSGSSNLSSNVTVNHWRRGTNTPRYASSSGYATPGLVIMWGNKVVSESISQKVSFEKGKTYKGCFAFKFLKNNSRKPDHVRYKLLASKIPTLNTPNCSGANCAVITTSQTIYDADGWQVHTFEWEATDNFYYLYITPENDSSVDGEAYISGSFFDDLCIEEMKCTPLKPYTSFVLDNLTVDGNVITSVKFQGNTSIPAGAVHWWQIYDAENCDDGDYTPLGEPTSTSLRNTGFSSSYTINSPTSGFPNLEVNKCYIIKHGMYYDPAKKGCGWAETRAKLKVSFSTNARGGKPKIEFVVDEMKKDKVD